jgi:NAD-dependent DNA ligase
VTREGAGSIELVAELSELVQSFNRAYLRETHPEASDEEIDALLARLILESHRNEFGPGSGFRRVPGWPRRR